LGRVPVISIIDDDVSVRIAVSRLVRSLGYLAHAYASADEFLNSRHAGDSSCVIADVQMPGTTGVELQKVLNEQEPSLPIIFITAFPEDSIRAQALKAGAVDLLSKPFNGTKLIECIERALNGAGEQSP
jgi:FixJ family two-component response regulator